LDAGGQPGSGGPAHAVLWNKSCSLSHCWEKPVHLSSYTDMSAEECQGWRRIEWQGQRALKPGKGCGLYPGEL
jgi:hypothetical protein